MCAPHSCLLSLALIMCLTMGPNRCMASENRNSCRVLDGRADCSHLSLGDVPLDLPGDIFSLDVSHNRLVRIPPASVKLYPGLVHLDASYNSISKLDKGVCQTLPLLQMLNLKHNQVYLLKKEDLGHCGNLTWLNMASNRLKLQGETFSALQNLKFLDVSKNQLQSAKLGSEPQLPRLVKLNLGFNDFTVLQRDDFSFLNQSSFLQVLNMSSVSLKRV